VCWRYETRDGKPTKVPYRAEGGGKASSSDPATWGTFSGAIAAIERDGHDGIGFMFANGWAGLDLDDCRDPETEVIAPWAYQILIHFAEGAYIEISPSGTGVHVMGRGETPRNGRTAYGDGIVEMYDTARYFTVTGDVLTAPDTIGDISAGLAAVYREVFAPREERPPLRVLPTPTTDDERVRALAFRASNGAETRALYGGDTSANGGDHSAADLALLSRLAFYTQDPDQLDRLFRRSALYRPKWERADYRERTIDRALSGLTETYNPARLSLDNNARTESHSPPLNAEASTGDPSDNGVVAALQAQVAELQEKLRIADAVAMRAVEMEALVLERDQQLRECAERNEAMRKVIAHPTMAASTKVVGLATLTHLNAREDSPKYTDPELGTRVDMGVIARLSGMGAKTTGKTAQDLDAAGLWKRTEVKWNPPGGGPPITKIWLKTDGTLTERTKALANLEVAGSGHGGRREKKICAVCGSNDVHRRSHKECHSCGHEWEKVTTPLNPSETDSQDDTPVYATDAGGQDDAQRYIDTTDGQDDAPCPQTVDAPVARRSSVVHFVPEPSDGIDEIDIWQGTQPPPSGLVCRQVFGQECYTPGCNHRPQYIPVGAG
jgi:hypothetical protein